MIESIIAVAVFIIGAFFAGMRSSVNKQKKRDLNAMRDARKNYEKVSRMDDDDQLAEFDRLREKRR